MYRTPNCVALRNAGERVNVDAEHICVAATVGD